MEETVTTNDKGDVGVAMVIADMTSKGIKVALPITHDEPFDIIAISKKYKLSRVSVKYLKGKNSLMLPLRTISACSKQVVRKVNFNNVDAYAVYSPIMNKCYYVHKQEILNSNNTTTFNLRITEPVVKGNNVFRMVSEYEDVNIIFGNVAESGLL